MLKTSVRLLSGAVILIGIAAAAGMLGMRLTGYELLSVESNSMRPFIQKGDAVLINQHDTDVSIGSVISFASPANARVIITHRVIGVDDKRGIIATKGDNAPLVDPPVPAWNVLGTVTHAIPKIGYLLDILKHPFGLLAIIYIPAAGIIWSELRRLSLFYATGSRARKVVHYRLHRKLA